MKTQTFAQDTSTRSKKEWAQGLLVLFIGLTIAHLGVSLFVLSELGSDTFTILVQGVANSVGLTIGTCHVIALIGLMVVMLLTTKNFVKPGTVVCAFCGGWIIDFFMWLLGGLVNGDSAMVVRLVAVVLGCVILGLGMSVVIQSNSGTGPNDLIAIILTDKLQAWRPVQFKVVRVICDVVFASVGYMLGGVFGIGTVVAALVIGPIVQFFLPRSQRVIHAVFPTL